MGLLGKNVADRRVLANEKTPEFFMQDFFRPCKSGGTLPANLQARNDILLPVNLLVQEAGPSHISPRPGMPQVRFE